MQYTGHGGRRENAGRKPLGETRKVSITLPEDLWKEIDRIAKQPNWNQSKVFRQMVENVFR